MSLTCHIPWEERGIEVIASASGGVEALSLIGRRRPDLMLLDIQMPDMDGLTLARLVREKEPGMAMVILSGHDNFQFAQKALELGVFKYLLKPAGDTEILEAVTEAAGQLRRQREASHEQALVEYKWHLHLPYLQNRFLLDWLRGRYRAEEIGRLASELQLNLPPEGRFAVAVIDPDEPPSPGEGLPARDASVLEYTLARMAKEQLQEGTYWICSDTPGSAVLLFALPEGAGEQEGLLQIHTATEKMLALLGSILSVTASAGICGSAGGACAVYELYQQACSALLRRKVYGGGLAIPYREPVQPQTTVPVPEPASEKALEVALQTGDRAKAKEALELLWEAAMGQGTADPEQVHEQVLYFSSLLVRTVRRQGWLLKDAAGSYYPYFQNIHLLTTAQQIQAWLSGTVERILDYAEEQGSQVNHRTVKSILELVEKELDQDLTLHALAERLYVNASYLSRLFKQEIGKPFSAYVLERKMERAKAALTDGAKVYDAALLAGYRDVSYFTKVFRRYWGTTPGTMKTC